MPCLDPNSNRSRRRKARGSGAEQSRDLSHVRAVFNVVLVANHLLIPGGLGLGKMRPFGCVLNKGHL